MRAFLLVAALLGASSSALAQVTTDFRSFRARPPQVSPLEIVTSETMATPSGRYRIRYDAPGGAPWESTFQLTACEAHTPTVADRQLVPIEGVWQACSVVEINRQLGCDGCAPHAVEFGRVVFARYTSPIPDENGRPVIDNWVGYLAIGVRRLRLLILEDRFLVHSWGAADPNMGIVEAPVRRLRP